jgi:hypothetical protein
MLTFTELRPSYKGDDREINVLYLEDATDFLKNAVFWDVMQCCSCKNRRFGEMYRHHHQVGNNQRVRNNVSSN